MTGKKITLRLKSEPSVVLPEATVEAGSDIYNWKLRFAKDTRIVTVSQADWEPVPPPYALPTGIGAVVATPDNTFIHTGRKTRLCWEEAATGVMYSSAEVLDAGELETLSEGVEL